MSSLAGVDAPLAEREVRQSRLGALADHFRAAGSHLLPSVTLDPGLAARSASADAVEPDAAAEDARAEAAASNGGAIDLTASSPPVRRSSGAQAGGSGTRPGGGSTGGALLGERRSVLRSEGSGVLELSSGGEDEEEDGHSASLYRSRSSRDGGDDLIILDEAGPSVPRTSSRIAAGRLALPPIGPPPGHPLAPVARPQRTQRPGAHVRFNEDSLAAPHAARGTRSRPNAGTAGRLHADEFEDDGEDEFDMDYADDAVGGFDLDLSGDEEEDDLLIDGFLPARPGPDGRYVDDEALARRLQAGFDRDHAAANAAGVGVGARPGRMQAHFDNLGDVYARVGGAGGGAGGGGRGRADLYGLMGILGGGFIRYAGFGHGPHAHDLFAAHGHEVGIPAGLQGVINDAHWGGQAKVRQARKWSKALSYPAQPAKPAPGFSRDILPSPDSDEEPAPPPKRQRKGSKKVHEELDPVCASCLEPLVLDPAREEKRPWVLACGHVVCGRCLDEAKDRKRVEEGDVRKSRWRPASINGSAVSTANGKGKGRAEVLVIEDEDEDEPPTEEEPTAPAGEEDQPEPDTDSDPTVFIAVSGSAARAGSVGVTRRSQAGTSTRSGAQLPARAPPGPRQAGGAAGAGAAARTARAKSQTPGLEQLKAANKAAKAKGKGKGKGRLGGRKAEEEEEREMFAGGGVELGWLVCPVAACAGQGGSVLASDYSGPFKLYF